MSDIEQAGLDGEHPVNPYSLLEAVNRASDTVNTAWLIFLGVLSYLLITAAGVTHKDLLLNSDIPLPILQVKIDLAGFFFFAPIILVLFHTGVVAQLVLLARKTLEFDTSIRLLETTERRTPSAAAGARQFLLRAGNRRARAVQRNERVPAWHVMADAGRVAGADPALHPGGVPPLSRRRHHQRRTASRCSLTS